MGEHNDKDIVSIEALIFSGAKMKRKKMVHLIIYMINS
jgi:hypothetical protein